jgi:hypothetical protein
MPEDKISIDKFASQIKEKYPQYKDIENTKLANAIIEKYPTYKDKVDFGTTSGQQSQKEQPKPTGVGVEPMKQKGALSSAEDITKGIFTPQAGSDERYNKRNKLESEINMDIEQNHYTLKSMWNAVLSSAQSTMDSFAELASKSTASAGVGAPGVGPQYRQKTKTPQERIEEAKKIKQDIEKEVFGKIKFEIPEEEQKKLEFDISDGIGMKNLSALAVGAARMVPDILQAELTGGTTFFLQGYADGVKEYDQSAEKSKISPNENARDFYGLTSGLVTGVLQKFTIDKIFRGAPEMLNNMKKKVIVDVMSNIEKSGEKYTVKQIENLVEQETKKAVSGLKGVAKRYGVPIITGAATGAAMAGEKDAAKFVTNKIQGKQIFDEKDIKAHLWKNIANSATQMGVLSGVMGGSMNLLSNTNNEILTQVVEAKNPEHIEKINDDLNKIMDKNNFTDEEKAAVKKSLDDYVEIKKTLPPDISDEHQLKVIPLIKDRRLIDEDIKNKTEQIKNTDESLQDKGIEELKMLQDRKEGINKEINDIINNTEEPIITDKEPDYTPSEEELKALEGKTPEQRVEALNKLKEDYDTARSTEGVAETPTAVSKDVLSKPVKEFGFGEVPDEQLSGFEKWRNDNREELDRSLKSGERNEDIGETEEQFLRKKYCKGL